MKSKVGLIVGGSGALGSSVVNVFKKNGWRLLNVDVKANTSVDSNFLIDPNLRLKDQVKQVHEHTKTFSTSFDSIICTAGGFEMGSIRDHDVLEKFDRLDRLNAQSALLTGHLAAHYLGE